MQPRAEGSKKNRPEAGPAQHPHPIWPCSGQAGSSTKDADGPTDGHRHAWSTHTSSSSCARWRFSRTWKAKTFLKIKLQTVAEKRAPTPRRGPRGRADSRRCHGGPGATAWPPGGAAPPASESPAGSPRARAPAPPPAPVTRGASSERLQRPRHQRSPSTQGGDEGRGLGPWHGAGPAQV